MSAAARSIPNTSVAGWRGNPNRRQEQQEGRREHRGDTSEDLGSLKPTVGVGAVSGQAARDLACASGRPSLAPYVTVTGGRDGATATGRGLKLATLPSSGARLAGRGDPRPPGQESARVASAPHRGASQGQLRGAGYRALPDAEPAGRAGPAPPRAIGGAVMSRTPRHPDITIVPNPKRVIVRLGGAVIADSTRALVMGAPGTARRCSTSREKTWTCPGLSGPRTPPTAPTRATPRTGASGAVRALVENAGAEPRVSLRGGDRDQGPPRLLRGPRRRHRGGSRDVRLLTGRLNPNDWRLPMPAYVIADVTVTDPATMEE